MDVTTIEALSGKEAHVGVMGLGYVGRPLAAAQRGLPIGSGVVEAACKTLVTERMKRSGMRWREAGGQAILTLRGWMQSGRFEAASGMLAGTYQEEVTVCGDESAHRRAA